MRILFAIGNRNAEEYLEKLLKKRNEDRALNDEPKKIYEFVGSAVHKDNIVNLIKTKGPDVLILREGFEGFKNIPPGSQTKEVPEIYEFAKSLKRGFPNLRIVFLAGQREIGDANLGNLVAYNIYDLLVGSSLNIKDVADLIDNPRDFKQASIYLPTNGDLIEDFEAETKKEEDSLVIDKKEFLVVEEKEVPIENKTVKESLPVAPGGDVVVAIDKQQGNQDSLMNKLMSGAKNVKDNAKNVIDSNKSNMVNKQINSNEVRPEKKQSNNFLGRDSFARPNQRLRPGRNTNIYMGKDKIITFYGSKNGVGTSLISFSIAMELALRKNRVLYIEYNDMNPTIAYWLGAYDAISYEDGIDKAVLGYETNSLKDVNEAIITMQSLVRSGGDFAEIFKKYPPTLDLLFFSEDYLLRRDKEPISSTSFTQVLLYYMQQMNYNYIIVDMRTGTNLAIVEKALTFSNKNYILLTQDISSLGYCKQFFDVLDKKGLDFSIKHNGKKSGGDKNNYIVNRYYNNVSLKEKVFKEWFDTTNIFTVPEITDEMYDITLNCLPIMKVVRNKDYRMSISNIASDIETL